MVSWVEQTFLIFVEHVIVRSSDVEDLVASAAPIHAVPASASAQLLQLSSFELIEVIE